ncbi:type II toxin-antitoxin system PemK/MazF family toxin [Marinobacter sp. bablab_jr008]|uniref:type II toxin-antitoxin system PemK/MazF family toxin n=1 Tax=Marinobacter sp. bablab_jr008 TaxID=2755064 RepID=UPI002EA9EE76|nr:type II toxin-antitoxin system PemK/MazF family toxin [Pseudomonadota bacterium]
MCAGILRGERRLLSKRYGTTRMMQPTTNFEFGDVVLVSFPFTNLKTTKKRPAVIISSEAYQSYRPDLVIMALTSQITESSRQRRVKRRGIFAGNKKASLRELA